MKRRDVGRLAALGGLFAFGCGTSSAPAALEALEALEAPIESGGTPPSRDPAQPGRATRGPGRHRYGDAPSQFGDLRVPAGDGPHPVAVVVHGGFWQSGYGLDLMEPVCETLLQAGFATWNIEYRRVGEPGGGWPGTFTDVGAAVDHLRDLAAAHPLDLDRIVAMGHSAGGHLALWIAGRHRLGAGDPIVATAPLPIAKAVSLAGVVDLRRAAGEGVGGDAVQSLIGGDPAHWGARYAAGSPADLLPIGVPQVLLHGRADGIVPAALSSDYVRTAKAKGDDATYVELPCSHFEVIDPTSAVWPEIAAAMQVERRR